MQEIVPQAEIVLEHAFATQSVEVKGAREWRRVRAHSLREKNDGVAVGDVEAVQHGLSKYIACDVSPVRGQVTVVGERVEARTWSASCKSSRQRVILTDVVVSSLLQGLTVVRAWRCPRFGFPGLSGLDVDVRREGQGRGCSCGQGEDRRESHIDYKILC